MAHIQPGTWNISYRLHVHVDMILAAHPWLNLPFPHIPNVLYWIGIWWLWRLFELMYCSRNQFEIIFCHCVLSCLKQSQMLETKKGTWTSFCLWRHLSSHWRGLFSTKTIDRVMGTIIEQKSCCYRTEEGCSI